MPSVLRNSLDLELGRTQKIVPMRYLFPVSKILHLPTENYNCSHAIIQCYVQAHSVPKKTPPILLFSIICIAKS